MADIHESECCVVCLEANPAYHFVPCNHKCVCEGCAKEYVVKDDTIYTRCPVCRREFDSITSQITKSMMMEEVRNDEEDEEEDQLQVACALSHSELANKIETDMLQEQMDLCTAILISQAEIRPTDAVTAHLSEDEMIRIACALSANEAIPKQEEPLETIDLTQDEILKDAPMSSINEPELVNVPVDASDLNARRLKYFDKVESSTTHNNLGPRRETPGIVRSRVV